MKLAKMLSPRLTESEKFKEIKDSHIRVIEENNFTYVIIKNKDGGVAVGTAKRNPNTDAHNPEIGKQLAATRAFRNYVKYGWI